MSDIRVRFAPSPTGYLHIGGVRTALFNYLYARQQGGKFLLRIEDTDRQRSTPEFEKEILDSLKWLGFDWDEELVHQSKRLDRYREVAQELVSKGLAYEFEGAIKFKIPQTQVKVYDNVRGEVAYDSKEFDDLVIMKSDGFPVFHLAVVVVPRRPGVLGVQRRDAEPVRGAEVEDLPRVAADHVVEDGVPRGVLLADPAAEVGVARGGEAGLDRC